MFKMLSLTYINLIKLLQLYHFMKQFMIINRANVLEHMVFASYSTRNYKKNSKLEVTMN